MRKKKREVPANQEAAKENAEQLTAAESDLKVEKIDEQDEGKIMELENKIIDLEKEKIEANDKYLRTLAEFENFRRRTSQERINWIKNANESIILKLCDIIDDFERAFDNHPAGEEPDHLYLGMEAIFRKLQAVMKSEGVTKIETETMEFDPMYHDAVTYTPSDLEKDRIVSVIQNGYIMNNKVIRPAKVVLSSGELQSAGESSEEEDDK